MAYNILKDYQFYIYVLIFMTSAVILINSVKKLIAALSTKELNNRMDETLEGEEPEKYSSPASEDNEIIIDEKGGEIDIKLDDKNNQQKIEFEDDEENLFKVKNNKDEDKDLAREFIMALNKNLEEIKSNLPSKDFIKKIYEMEEKIDKLEKQILDSAITQRLSEIEKRLELILNYKSDKDASISPPTPKYIYKYIEDIVEDYENIDKEMIKKRLKIILADLSKIVEEDGK